MATKKPSGPDSSNTKRTGRKKEKASPRTKADRGARKVPADESGRSAPPFSSVAGFPIVGIGASAGGLEAFVDLLSELGTDTGMAFVFIQHYRPGKPSMLSEILRRESSMEVINVRDGMTVEPNHIYVHASYEPLSLRDNVFAVRPESEAGDSHMPIDYFFHALADTRGSGAIGIVLSGTASDGTLGLKAIKGAGGITIVEDPQTARYDGMPTSAIAAGAATFIMKPAEIGRELGRIAQHPYLMESVAEVDTAVGEGEDVNAIFELLRKRFGVDFTYYKHSTIMRRIHRRMVVQRQTKVADYVDYLRKTPAELEALYHDMLINVTGFFREPEAYEVLRENIFPRLLDERDADEPLRIWVPGCASGEEVYSIAMTLLDTLEEHKRKEIGIQIFATDIDDEALSLARIGIYPPGIAQVVPAAYLQRHFTQVPQGYQISKRIRDLCVFSQHNIIQDPPFSRLDFISCRNLLIYLGSVLQKKVVPVLHFALRTGGYLMLGSAENIGDAANLFEIVDKSARVYRKKAVDTPMRFEFNPPGEHVVPTRVGGERNRLPHVSRFDLHQAIDELLVREYSPPAVVIDRDMQIVEFRGHTGRFLEPAAGEATLHLLKMAREGLVAELRAAVIQAMEKNQRVHKQELRADFGDGERNIRLEVIPMREAEKGENYYLVVFHEAPAAQRPAAEDDEGEPPARPPAELQQEIDALQQELAATKDYLHSVIEQQELTNEDLRCANEEVQSSYEELQSSNEELQSTNEELETAKEELQSTNEELRTVNDELENRNAELSVTNNDLHNLINSVDMPIAMVGIDGRIRRFSPQAQALLNLIETDVGRPISNIRANLPLQELNAKIRLTVDKVQLQEEEIQDETGHWYLLRIHPYRTLDNRIDGAVLVFVDINDMKRTLEENQQARAYAEAIIAAMRHPLLVLDPDLKVVSVSEAYLEVFGVTEKETVGNRVNHLGNGQWAIPKLQQALESVLNGSHDFEDFEVEHAFPGIGRKKVLVSGRRVAGGPGRKDLILMQMEQTDS